MGNRITIDQVRKFRTLSQRMDLEGTATSPKDVLGSILAVQAQDLQAGYLSIRARGTGITLEQLKQIHWGEAELAWSWTLRGTLHLVTCEDLRWLLPLLGPELVRRDRTRMSQLGWEEETAKQGVELVVTLLNHHGELSRAEIAGQLKAHGLPYEGQATMHLLYRTVAEGLVTTVRLRGNKPVYGLFGTRYPLPERNDNQDGFVRLARRYLQGYAPATVEDFASWSGIKIVDARSAWEKIRKETVDIVVEGRKIQIPEDRMEWLGSVDDHSPTLRLLPHWDTYLLGYASRSWLIDPAHEHYLYPGGGIITASVVLDGKIIGYWNLNNNKTILKLNLVLFEKPPNKIDDLIESEAADIGHYFEKNVALTISNIA